MVKITKKFLKNYLHSAETLYIYICDSSSLFLGYASESFSFDNNKNFFDIRSVILNFQISTADLKSKV